MGAAFRDGERIANCWKHRSPKSQMCPSRPRPRRLTEASGSIAARSRRCLACSAVFSESALADLGLAAELLDQAGQRDGGQRLDSQGPARCEIYGQVRNGLVVGGFHDADEVVRTQDRVLPDDLQPNSSISRSTSSTRSGCWWRVLLPSGVKELDMHS